MLIYNHKQEFMGIGEKDLRSLGFRNLADLQSECHDFADLFVKRPTYIHNFKNFNWIYYILNSDIGEAKVIISAKHREFSATLEIETIYLTDAPTEPAYSVTLTKLRALDGIEIEQSKLERVKAPITKVDLEPENEFIPSLENEKTVVLSEPDIFETPPQSNIVSDPYDFDFNAPLEIEDAYSLHDNDEDKFKIEHDFDFSEFEKTTENLSTVQEEQKTQNLPDEKPKAKPMLGDNTILSKSEYVNNLQVSKDYVYNPQIASDELGLPVDLIEEFIGDFIQQSYDFKNELYDHLANEELGDLKLLSHKLKGVAANLRIEDAFEVLSIINTSSNMDEIRATLDHFFKIISKLEGKEPVEEVFEEKIETKAPVKVETPIKVETPVEDDIFLLKDLDEENETEKFFKAEAEVKTANNDYDIYDIDLKFDDDEEPLIEQSKIDTLDVQPKEANEAPTEVAVPEEIYEIPAEAAIPEEIYKMPTEVATPAEVIDTLDYNKSAAVNELGLPADLIEELLGDFKEDALAMFKDLEIAANAHNRVALQDIVMNIKGTADNLRVTKISKTLEDLLSVNDNQEIKNLLIRLNNYINQL